MVSKTRLKRISDRIKEELSLILLREASDPRLEDVYITHVRVDQEVAFADIYIFAREGRERLDEIMEGLNHAQGYLRSELAHRLSHLRSLPQLRFHWDETLEKAARIDQLIADIEAEEASNENGEESDE